MIMHKLLKYYYRIVSNCSSKYKISLQSNTVCPGFSAGAMPVRPV